MGPGCLHQAVGVLRGRLPREPRPRGHGHREKQNAHVGFGQAGADEAVAPVRKVPPQVVHQSLVVRRRQAFHTQLLEQFEHQVGHGLRRHGCSKKRRVTTDPAQGRCIGDGPVGIDTRRFTAVPLQMRRRQGHGLVTPVERLATPLQIGVARQGAQRRAAQELGVPRVRHARPAGASTHPAAILGQNNAGSTRPRPCAPRPRTC